MHRTLLDEHFRVKGRTTWYESVEQMQIDLDEYLRYYNHERCDTFSAPKEKPLTFSRKTRGLFGGGVEPCAKPQ